MYLEKRVVNSDVVRSWAGLGAGLVVALANLGAAVWLVMNGHDWAGAALASTSLGGLVGVFIYGTNSARRERIEKEKIKLGRK